jgi:CRP-like cAMP-binding protein
MARARPWSAPAGRAIYRAGDVVDALWLIDEGAVIFQADTDQGQTLALATSHTGHCFGEIEVLSGFTADCSAISLRDTRGWRIVAADVHALMQSVAPFSALLAITQARNARLMHRLYQHALLMPDAPRLALTLLNAARQSQGHDGHRHLVVPMTQEQLAQFTGTTRQFVNKRLNEWVAQGWLTTAYRQIEVTDRDGLIALLSPWLNGQTWDLQAER